MILDRRPFVPPACPVEQVGRRSISSEADFSVSVMPFGQDTDGNTTHIEVQVTFNEGGKTSAVQSDIAEFAQDSATADGLHDITDGVTLARSTESQRVAKLGQAFCERIIHCRGVVDGECWALGASAMQETINSVSTDS